MSAAPSPGHATGSRFAPLFQVAATRAPSPSPSPLRRPLSYLSMQHFVARFSGALLPWGLFPYLGGKMNRETERGPSWRLGVLRPAQPSRGVGWSSGGPVGVRQCRGLCPLRYPRLPSGVSRLPATTALRRPAPRSGQVRMPRSELSPACGRRARPPPHNRVRAHTRHTPARALAHTRLNAGGLGESSRPLGGSGTSPG